MTVDSSSSRVDRPGQGMYGYARQELQINVDGNMEHGEVGSVLRLVRALVVVALIILTGVALISPEMFADGMVGCAGRIYAVLHGLASSVAVR